MHLQEAAILTDNLSLAKAAAARSPMQEPGHWGIRGLLADFCAIINPYSAQVIHINRDHNAEAHRLAQLALKQDSLITPRLNCSNPDHYDRQSFTQVITHVHLQGIVVTDVQCYQLE